MTFGTKLRKYRERKRLSQREVADRIGVSQSTYSNWEADIRSFRVEYLAKLAQLFDIPIPELLSEGMGTESNYQHKAVVETFVLEDRRELYTNLLKSKDEIIQLLKEENSQLKIRNIQLEDRQKAA